MTTQYTSVLYFSLDHTLFEGPWDSAVFRDVSEEIGRKSGLDPEQIRRALYRVNKTRRVAHRRKCAVWVMDWDDIARTVALNLGVTLETSVLELVYKYAASHTRVLDNAVEVLEELQCPDRALVVATRGLAKYQRPMLEALGLISFFDDILTPDTNQALKQSPGFYGSWLSASPLQIIVGDNVDDDVFAPHRFGFKTIWISRDRERKAQGMVRMAEHGVWPDRIIGSLEELPAIVERFEREASSVHLAPVG